MHSKYNNMHKNGINYVLKYTNHHLITSKYYMFSSASFDGWLGGERIYFSSSN